MFPYLIGEWDFEIRCQFHFGFTCQVNIHNLFLIVSNIQLLVCPDVVAISSLLNLTNNTWQSKMNYTTCLHEMYSDL